MDKILTDKLVIEGACLEELQLMSGHRALNLAINQYVDEQSGGEITLSAEDVEAIHTYLSRWLMQYRKKTEKR
jgi:hypothetical protein